MDADILKELLDEFIVETSESLNVLEKDLLGCENASVDTETLNRIFRTIHTIKGSGGSLALGTMESLSHEAEQLLDKIREEHLELSPESIALLLELVDVLRGILVNLQQHGAEGSERHDGLRERLEQACAALLEEDGEAVAKEAPEPTGSDQANVSSDDSSVADASEPDASASPVQESTPESDRGDPDPDVEIIEPEAFVGEGQAWGLFGDAEEAESSAKAKPAAEASAKAASPTESSSISVRNSASRDKEESGSKGNAGAEVSESSIRVEIKQLDNLMALVGELVLTRNQIVQQVERVGDSQLDQSVLHLDHITSELQQGMMKTRMQPIGNAWTKLPRIVRDLAKSLGKEIRLEMEGKETELDRSLIEAIKDPLLHLVRNSVDHGIETLAERQQAGKDPRGTLFLSAYHESGQVNIDIVDDGRGIDLDKIRAKALEHHLFTEEQLFQMSDRETLDLVFHPGLSTADKVSNISGRGVGMDVARSNIEKIGGSIDIHSELGQGTSIKLKIPLTLAIVPALMIGSGKERFAIPQLSLQELVRLEGDEIEEKIESLYDTRVYRLRGEIIPVVSLNEVLNLEPAAAKPQHEDEEAAMNIVVLQSEGQSYGLIVDAIYDSEEIVVKPLSSQLKRMSCYSGATIMGDGRVALILDAQGIGNLSHAFNRRRDEAHGKQSEDALSDRRTTTTLLLFNAGEGARMAVPLIDVNRIEEIPSARLEWIRGDLRVQHRGRILKLVHLSKFVPGIPALNTKEQESVSVIVFSKDDRAIGLVVKDVLDIVDESIDIQEPSKLDFLIGAQPIAGKVTELLDVNRLMDLADPILLEQKSVNA